MKLRNKKTGEIINYKDLFTDEFISDLFSKSFSYFDTVLNKIQEEWELYNEPKEKYFFINWYGAVDDEIDDGYEVDISCKEIGNYFKTKKEAELAVEKLKAWKRLRDKGFRFDGYEVVHNSNGDLCGQLFYNAGDYCIEDVDKDLDLLFGGEE
jgi:hypothetical protein